MNTNETKTNNDHSRPKRHLKSTFIESNIRNTIPGALAISNTKFTSKSSVSASENIVYKTGNVNENPENSSQYFGHLDCGPTQCTYISCAVGPLKKREHVVFRVRSRLWTTTVAKVSIINL